MKETEMPQQQTPGQIQLQHVDRVEISETYVDLLNKASIDSGVVKLEFCVNRLDDPQPPKPPTGKKVTALRLVLPITGFAQMVANLNGLLNVLEQQGVIKKLTIAPSVPGKPN
jgi:hypothetical protein